MLLKHDFFNDKMLLGVQVLPSDIYVPDIAKGESVAVRSDRFSKVNRKLIQL